MAIPSISGLNAHIREQEVRLELKNLELEDVRERMQANALILNSHFTKLRAIDPNLVGLARSQTTSKIVKIAVDLFYAIKKGFFRLFTPLNRQIREFQHYSGNQRQINLEESQIRLDIRVLTSDILATRREIERLEAEEQELDELEQNDFQEMQFDLELGWRDLAPGVVVSVVDTAKSVFNYVGSFFQREAVQQEAPLPRRDSDASTASENSSQSAFGGEVHEDVAAELEALNAHSRLNIQRFKDNLHGIASGWGFDDETAQALRDNFFPPIQDAVLNSELADRGIIAYDLTFNNPSCMDARLWGHAAEFRSQDKLTIEFDHMQQMFKFHENKFTAHHRTGTFALMSLWAKNNHIYMRGKPLAGALSYLIRSEPKVTFTREDFLELFNENKFRPL